MYQVQTRVVESKDNISRHLHPNRLLICARPKETNLSCVLYAVRCQCRSSACWCISVDICKKIMSACDISDFDTYAHSFTNAHPITNKKKFNHQCYHTSRFRHFFSCCAISYPACALTDVSRSWKDMHTFSDMTLNLRVGTYVNWFARWFLPLIFQNLCVKSKHRL